MKFKKNLFQTVTNNPINSKRALEEKKSKAVKDRGGSRVGMTAVKYSMVFFYPFHNTQLHLLTAYHLGLPNIYHLTFNMLSVLRKWLDDLDVPQGMHAMAQTDRIRYVTTYRLNLPRGWFNEKLLWCQKFAAPFSVGWSEKKFEVVFSRLSWTFWNILQQGPGWRVGRDTLPLNMNRTTSVMHSILQPQ